MQPDPETPPEPVTPCCGACERGRQRSARGDAGASGCVWRVSVWRGRFLACSHVLTRVACECARLVEQEMQWA